MGLSTAQKIGVGGLLGGVASIGTSMLLRYYASTKGTQNTDGSVDFPIWWEHAPLIGIGGGAVATALVGYLWGTEAAVACGAVALIAGVAPEADAWVVDARSEKDLADPATAPATQADCVAAGRTWNAADGTCAGLCNVVEIRGRVAAMEASIEELRQAA